MAQKSPDVNEQPTPPANQKSSPETVREILARTKPEDYDGHTEFSRMSALERLRWLDQAVLFIAAQKRSTESLRVAETASDYRTK